MRFNIRPWVLALCLATVCVCSVLALFAYRSLRGWNARQMTAALPLDDAVVVYLDIGAIRDSGLLGTITGSKAVEEAEYRNFVEESGFDYKADLDRIVISFQNQARYGVALGRFDWNRIKTYATRTGGQCRNGVCEVRSSEFVERSLSFYPMHGSAMALSSSPGSGGVYSVGPTRAKGNEATLAGWPMQSPVWIRVPAAVWRDAASLPTGARIFGSALEPAVNTFFIVQSSTDRKLSLELEAVCATTADAAKIHKHLEDATNLLRSMLARDKLTPKSSDLAALLIGGAFRLEGTRVRGGWPLDMALVHSIFEGEVR